MLYLPVSFTQYLISYVLKTWIRFGNNSVDKISDISFHSGLIEKKGKERNCTLWPQESAFCIKAYTLIQLYNIWVKLFTTKLFDCRTMSVPTGGLFLRQNPTCIPTVIPTISPFIRVSLRKQSTRAISLWIARCCKIPETGKCVFTLKTQSGTRGWFFVTAAAAAFSRQSWQTPLKLRAHVQLYS